MNLPHWRGMLTIARLNWPFYAVAATVLLASIVGVSFSLSLWGRLLFLGAAAGAGWFIFGSLGTSHLIYDRSDLYGFGWVKRALQDVAPSRAAYCHCGFDDASPRLREKLPGAQWLILDHYDPSQMTEPSIRRARKLYPPADQTIAAPSGAWPLPDFSQSVIFGFLAIHELRTHAARTAWFYEARRCLSPGGRLVLVEHLRDFPNFLAFGPGFLHFHSQRTWRRAWEAAGFREKDGFRVTPWVRVFVLSVR